MSLWALLTGVSRGLSSLHRSFRFTFTPLCWISTRLTLLSTLLVSTNKQVYLTKCDIEPVVPLTGLFIFGLSRAITDITDGERWSLFTGSPLALPVSGPPLLPATGSHRLFFWPFGNRATVCSCSTGRDGGRKGAFFSCNGKFEKQLASVGWRRISAFFFLASALSLRLEMFVLTWGLMCVWWVSRPSRHQLFVLSEWTFCLMRPLGFPLWWTLFCFLFTFSSYLMTESMQY